MKHPIQVIVLCDNFVGKPGLLGEHGFALFVKFNDKALLFDTGAGYTLLHNAQSLNIPINSLSHIVISHGHYDHTGGMKKLLSVATPESIWIHPSATRRRYIRDNTGQVREIGFRGPVRKVRNLMSTPAELQYPANIYGDIYLLGNVSKRFTFEEENNTFYLDADCTIPDCFVDEQIVVIESKKQRILLLGCTHMGIINTLTYIQETFSSSKPLFIIGGLHLHQASAERLQKTVRYLKEFNIQAMYPCHCTGVNAICFLSSRLSFPIRIASVGATFQFD